MSQVQSFCKWDTLRRYKGLTDGVPGAQSRSAGLLEPVNVCARSPPPGDKLNLLHSKAHARGSDASLDAEDALRIAAVATAANSATESRGATIT